MIYRTLLFALLFAPGNFSSAAFRNALQGPFTGTCPPGMHINVLRSSFIDKKHDRLWGFYCSKGFVTDDCVWSDFVNELKGDMMYICPNDGIVTGLHSYYDQAAEDRQWMVKCCKRNTRVGRNCQWTDYINELEGRKHYNLTDISETKQSITGIQSRFDEATSDRQMRLRICEFASCKPVSLQIDDNIPLHKTGTLTVNLEKSQVCTPGTVNQVSLAEKNRPLTEVRSIKTVHVSGNWTYDPQITLESTFNSFYFHPTPLSMELRDADDGSGGKEWSQETEFQTAYGQSADEQTMIQYDAPGAAFIMAQTDQYEFDGSDMGVTYTVQCDDGSQFKDPGTINLYLKRFTEARRITSTAVQDPKDCNAETKACLDNISNSLGPDDMTNQFEQCYQHATPTLF